MKNSFFMFIYEPQFIADSVVDLMRRSGFEPEFKRWQRSVITATLPAQTDRGIHLII